MKEENIIHINSDFMIINDNSLNMLDYLEEESVDAIVCDPPYELGFMGKKWDSTGIAYNVELWKKANRVLKRGGHLLAFGGTRTFHRIACAIEDVGFEIRDTIMWLYGSGFPKSMNVGLEIDKLLGNESKVIGTYDAPDNKDIAKKQGCSKLSFGQVENTKRIQYEIKEAQNEWKGYGTNLKPAFEPIIVARKPTNLTIAKNCLKYGVGGINIDECRVGDEHFEINDSEYDNNENQSCYGNIKRTPKSYVGRFPANVITDGSDEVASGMPIENNKSAMRYFYQAKASKKDRDDGLDIFGFEDKNMRTEQNRDIHSAGCEYIENGKLKQNPHLQSSVKKNIHPTVKPVELMQYLVRLVSPKGATVLDIFNGSGSTGKAVAFENRERNANYKYIGIELSKEYCEISKARIDYAINKFEYDAIKEDNENREKGQINLFDFDFGGNENE